MDARSAVLNYISKKHDLLSVKMKDVKSAPGRVIVVESDGSKVLYCYDYLNELVRFSRLPKKREMVEQLSII